MNAYSSAIFPSSHRATVTIEIFSAVIPVTTVQSSTAILIGRAIILLFDLDVSKAHWMCGSIPLVVF